MLLLEAPAEAQALVIVAVLPPGSERCGTTSEAGQAARSKPLPGHAGLDCHTCKCL